MKILRPSIVTGYHQLHLQERRKKQQVKVYTLVLCAFVGPRPHGYQCNHKNGVKTDNRLANLEWVTPRQNSRHAVDVLGRLRGEQSPVAKISEGIAIAIRNHISNGELYHNIARRYRIPRGIVAKIATGESWKYLGPSPGLGYLAGERNRNTKLSNKNVARIKKDISRNLSIERLARKYAISPGIIRSIANGTGWKTVV